MKKKIGERKGITLIALVITIVVLLLLVGVSITTLTGENGVLTKTKEAKQTSNIAEARERVQLEVAGSFKNNGAYDKNLVKENLKNNLGIDSGSIKENIEETLEVTYKGVDLLIQANGKVEYKDRKGNQTEKLPSNEDTKPFLPEGAQVTNKDIDSGLTIKDKNGNEWVWIEVPKSIYENPKYNGGIAPQNSKDYDKIESVMHEYTKTYRNGTNYKDIWFAEDNTTIITEETEKLTPKQKKLNNGCGLTYDEYVGNRHRMLESVYENGGFYIGKYETGTETPRGKEDALLTIPVIRQDVYPYNFVKCTQAQSMASTFSTQKEITSSLMFGVQWDLVLKHIEAKTVKKEGKSKLAEIQKALNIDSLSWGNYRDGESFEINRGKYADLSYSFKNPTFVAIEGNYIKKQYSEVLLSTGASDINNKFNIYDLAGNLYEWTLEMSIQQLDRTIIGSTIRGGNFFGNGSKYPSSVRIGSGDLSMIDNGFRVTLY